MMKITPTRTPPRLRRTGIALVVAVAGLATLAGWFHLQTPAQASAPQAVPAVPPATPVTVAAVLSRPVIEWDEFSGRLEAVERVEVRARVSGHIESVNFKAGALVDKGATLFTIDARPFAAEMARAEAALVAARSRLALTDTELARAASLLADQAISRREFEQRQNARDDAQAAVRAAEAAVEIARLDLAHTRITAPIAGRVGRAELTAGNLVAAGAGSAPLTTIVSTASVHASFEADEQTYLKALAASRAGGMPGLPVRMALANEDGFPREGRIDFVDNAIDPSSGTIRMRALFDNRDGRLTPGMFARIRLAAGGERNALLIDERAVGTDQSKKFVWVVDAQQRVAYREVTLGPLVDGLRVVRSGLKAGETIVVNGVQRVRPGVLVAPTTTPMDARANATVRLAMARPGRRAS
ncbi:efflux RND transporter periplasmic adaptor subunit [Piscinibacter sakaiensis]|uniref:efflux RND transporter periplasmic adaptor subunit n=1 Tax=Piscinibacter sakaiensis TaxID=1547922 RepID=UPI003AB0B478